MNYFDTHPNSSISDNDKYIMESKICRDKLKNYIKRLEKDVTINKNKAKELLKNKEREKAKLFLSKSKICIRYIESSQAQLNMVEEQLNNFTVTLHQKETIKVLQKGNEILKELQQEVNYEKLESITEEMKDIRECNDELSKFLKNLNLDSVAFNENIENEMQQISCELVENSIEYKNNISTTNNEIKHADNLIKMTECHLCELN